MHAGVTQPQSNGTVLSQGTELRPQEPSCCTRLSLEEPFPTHQGFDHTLCSGWSTSSIPSQSKIRHNFARYLNSMQSLEWNSSAVSRQNHNALPCWSFIDEESNTNQGKRIRCTNKGQYRGGAVPAVWVSSTQHGAVVPHWCSEGCTFPTWSSVAPAVVRLPADMGKDGIQPKEAISSLPTCPAASMELQEQWEATSLPLPVVAMGCAASWHCGQ